MYSCEVENGVDNNGVGDFVNSVDNDDDDSSDSSYDDDYSSDQL